MRSKAIAKVASFVEAVPLVGRLATARPQAPAADGGLNLNRQVLNLAWPSLVENLLQTMLGVVDLLMVGRLGADAIAGVGLANQIMNLLVVTFAGLAVGNTALVARSVGAGQKAEAERIAKQSLVMGAMLAAVVGIVGFFFNRQIIALLGGSPTVSEQGGRFLQIIATGSIVMMVMLIGGGTLRGSGDTRTPMLITGFINVINIGLAYTFIFGNFGFPALGVAGSALATTIARTVGSGLILWVLFRRGSVLKLPWRGGWRPRGDVVRRLLNVGGPAAIEQVVFGLGFVTFSVIVISLGTADLAAQQIAFNAASISILPAFAFSVAATTLVGQSLGAQKPQRAEASARSALRSALIWMCVMGVGFLLFRRQLVGLYTSDPDVLRLGAMCMAFIGLGQPFQAISIVLGGALRGAGDTRSTMVITLVGLWGMRLGLGFLFGIVLGGGLFGVWLGWAADFICRATLVTLRYRSGRWKYLRV